MQFCRAARFLDVARAAVVELGSLNVGMGPARDRHGALHVVMREWQINGPNVGRSRADDHNPESKSQRPMRNAVFIRQVNPKVQLCIAIHTRLLLESR